MATSSDSLSPLLPGFLVSRPQCPLGPPGQDSPSLEPQAPSGRPGRVNTLCYLFFNPQMGRRLTLFGSGTEKALTIICF